MRHLISPLVLCVACACSNDHMHDVRAGDSSTQSKNNQAGKGVTATDQSNNPADVDLTARVRRALVDDSSLSVMAENLTVVSKDGVVTVRGAVKSADEVTRVENVVRGVTGVSRVDAHIDVKP